jgi:glycosyltransferase involved in cell wall biosynthesis
LTARSLVTVLTPVYNGEAFIGQCIESVRAQTYDGWDYVLVDNASTDRTGEILQAYAARDHRIRVQANDRTLPVMANHNIAARQLNPAARWCKFVSADDTLLPECLERMVSLGEAHPSVGLVSAYQLQGATVGLGGLPYPSPVTPGRRIGRQSLLGSLWVFGGPTAHMIRADLVRARDPFYDESNLHADAAACYEVLKSCDLGFVHQVLTYARAHRGSVTFTISRHLNTYLLGHLAILKAYGPVYLTREEYDLVLKERLDTYYTFLARTMLAPGGREIWHYHRDGLRSLGVPFEGRRLARALMRQVRQVLLSPGTELPRVMALLRARGVEDTTWRHWWAPTGLEPVASVTESEPADRPGLAHACVPAEAPTRN